VAVLLLGQPAAAFYWYGWPGAGVTPPVTVTARPKNQLPPDETTPPGISPEPPEFPTPTDPHSIPEPGTLIAVAVGLAAVGMARRWRRGRPAV
jgi:hypothetical protein